MFRAFLTGIILLSVTCSAQPVADVEVVVTDTFGASLRSYKIELLKDDGFAVAKIDHKSPKQVRIPFGSYTVVGSASLHDNMSMRVTVDRSHLVLPLAFAYHDSGLADRWNTALNGNVSSKTVDRSCLLIHAMAVFGTFRGYARVKGDGTFEIPEVPYGDYLLVTTCGPKVLNVHPFRKVIREDVAVISLE